MVQISVSFPSSVGIQLSRSGTLLSICFNESKARHFATLADLVLTSNACSGIGARSCEFVLGDLCSDLTEGYSPALLNEHGMQLGI